MPDIKTGTISITGLSDLEKRLSDFPDKLARNILAGAIRAGAVVIQKEARQLAPISDRPHMLGKGSKALEIQPGTLKKSIKVRLAPRKSRERPIEYWVYVSKKAWYWKFVEFGTSKMAQKQFMRPAFDGKKEAAIEAIRIYMSARIDKEAAKI
jgi:HK97 gp10 family phage protein